MRAIIHINLFYLCIYLSGRQNDRENGRENQRILPIHCFTFSISRVGPFLINEPGIRCLTPIPISRICVLEPSPLPCTMHIGSKLNQLELEPELEPRQSTIGYRCLAYYFWGLFYYLADVATNSSTSITCSSFCISDAPLLTQLLADGQSTVVEDGPNIWTPANNTVDPSETPDSWPNLGDRYRLGVCH